MIKNIVALSLMSQSSSKHAKREGLESPSLLDAKLTSVCTECIGLFTVNNGVDAGDLVFSLYTESDGLFNRESDDQCENEGVQEHRSSAECLHEELVPSEAECCANAITEDSDVQSSDDSTNEVDTHHVE